MRVLRASFLIHTNLNRKEDTQMKKFTQMSREELLSELENQKKIYEGYKAMSLKLDMSRGKPDTDQLNLTEDMLDILDSSEKCLLKNGLDCRNYGLLDGIPEAKQLFADLLDLPAENIIVGGNSSLNIMYDTVVRHMLYGASPEHIPWIKQEGQIKFLCPCPGYDRHFAICESLGIEMINVPMTPQGPDMDIVEKLVASDPMIKGIWCVPKYSNPMGITYSDETVKRFARLKCAADDFRIFWDNAYVVHDIYDEGDKLTNIVEEALKANNPHIVYVFTSTSKISFPGSGISALAASKFNIDYVKSIMASQTIGCDKLNMLRHILYFKNADGVKEHMKKHAALLRPKFEMVLSILDQQLSDKDIAEWTKPRGGYFISFDMKLGSAKRVYELAKECGVTLTNAGATFPYGKDPKDSNLRIAPSYPPISELDEAANVLCCCVKIAAIERLLEA